MDSLRIAQIAEALKPAQAAYDTIWDNADQHEPEELYASVAAFNAAICEYALHTFA